MPAAALAFALAAAVFHAVWNLLLAGARDVEAATAVAIISAEVVFAPFAILTWHADHGLWPFIVVSGTLELVYFALLATAYRLAPLSVVYPIARGGAPVVVLIVSVAALGYETSTHQVIGVLLIVAGVILVRGFGHANAAGLGFGVAIACAIASYTLVDKHGIEHANPFTYLELTMLIPMVGLRRRRAGGEGRRIGARCRSSPRVRRGGDVVRRLCVRACGARARVGSVRRGGARNERRHRGGVVSVRSQGARHALALSRCLRRRCGDRSPSHRMTPVAGCARHRHLHG